MYKTEDCGLFIGLMTMPFGKEEPFLEKEIMPIFDRHRQEIVKHCNADDSEADLFNGCFYRPKSYGLFGSFDVAVFALVDDFSLATRYFHPYSPSAKRSKGYQSQNFAFNVISGICPDLSYFDASEAKLTARMQPILEGKAGACIGITSLKINNALLVGTGGRLVNLIVRKIQQLFKRYQQKEPRLSYLINHSFSWHELTLSIFADDYQVIKDIIFELRRLNLAALQSIAEESGHRLLFEDVVNDSLLRGELDRQEGVVDKEATLSCAHLFVHTNTIFGYDLDLLVKKDKEIPPVNDLSLYVRWNVKPGHLNTFVNGLHQKLEAEQIPVSQVSPSLTAGRGDYALRLDENPLMAFLQLIKAIRSDWVSKHIRHMNTTLEFKKGARTEGMTPNLDGHYLFHDDLSHYCIDVDTIREVRTSLKALRVPKITRERITNMYVMYNDGINDPVLYGYFIELKAFLDYTVQLIRSLKKEQLGQKMVQTIVSRLDPAINIFEYGYKNRFGQSYLLNEITDYNIEFNGGIQQLVSAYDGAYKSQTALLGERIGRSIAYVAGFSDTVSDIASVRLNYFHLYQPELFASAVTHEAANHLIIRLKSNAKVGGELHKMIMLYEELEQASQAKTGPDPLGQAVRYFLIDIATLYIGFNANFERFFYWQWLYFLQSAESYQVDGSVKPLVLEGFLSRMMLVDQVFHANEVGGTNYFFEKKVLPPFVLRPDTKLVAAWETAVLRQKRHVIDIMASNKKVYQDTRLYLSRARDYALSLLVDEFIHESAQEESKVNVVRGKIKRENKKLYERIDKLVYEGDSTPFNPSEGVNPKNNYLFIRRARAVYLEHIAGEIANYFREGKVYSVRDHQQSAALSEARDSFFYQALFNVYLMLIQELCGDTFNIRHRNEVGEVENIGTTDAKGSLEVDPLGGLFSSDLKLRRQYYQYRVLFLKSLWNLSMLNKRTLFQENV